MVDIISFSKVIEHERLFERLRDLRDVAATACRAAPLEPAGPVLVFTAAALISDIYRLVSREPGSRALARLDRRQRPSHRALDGLLREARLVLDAFAWAHRDHLGETGDDWLTREGLDQLSQGRQINLSA